MTDKKNTDTYQLGSVGFLVTKVTQGSIIKNANVQMHTQ